MNRRDLLLSILFGVSSPACLLLAYCSELPGELAGADNLFKKGDYTNSRVLYKKLRQLAANKNHPDEWKYCTLQIIRCSRRLRDLLVAVEEYFQYCRVDSAAPLETIPIIWSTSTSLIKGSKPNSQTALNMLRQLTTSESNPAAELLAASVLAADRELSLRNIGLHHLRKLANKPESEPNNTNNNSPQNTTIQNKSKITLEKNVMLLAGVLLWKEQIPILRNEKELTPMKQQLKQLPETLRAGSLFLYGKASAQVGLLEEAILLLMKIPIQYAEDSVLVIDALNESAKILDKLNRKNQAEQLRNEAKELERNSEP
ncbi:MAG: hypothetical protein LBC74_11620 [Planctomycetaceae bacterium]|jgi:tetratricopeptide (TPR) repeat protein|nr:hypothetical protein [Planctomycetaceae bacterium]